MFELDCNYFGLIAISGRIKFKTSSGGSFRLKRTRGKAISNEMKLKRLLLRDYDITSRPVLNDSTTVTVSVGMSLFHILDTVSACLWCVWRRCCR